MKKRKFVQKVIIYLLVFTMLGSSQGIISAAETGNTEAAEVSGIWKVGESVTATLDNNVLTISGTGPMYDYNTDDTVNPFVNTVCGSETGNVQLIIQSGVTSIGEHAFSKCAGITNVEIGRDIAEIGAFAFYSCSQLTDVIIPENVTVIGINPFASCSSLASLSVAASNKKYDSRNECNAIIEASANKVVSACQNTVLPNNVQVIGTRAFQGCSAIENVRIPYSVTRIEGAAFMECSNLKEIKMVSGLKAIEWGAFFSCSSLQQMELPDTVTEIDTGYLFYGCKKLTVVTLPDTVTEIAAYAFYNCQKLTGFQMPKALERIGIFAFYNCMQLTEIVIPKNVSSIGICPYYHNSPFWGCGGVERITVDSENPYYDSRNDCNAIIETATNKLITGCNRTVIPDSVAEIAAYAFSGCSGLTEVVLSKNITKIGTGAFENCTSLSKIKNDSENALRLTGIRHIDSTYNWYLLDTEQIITEVANGETAVFRMKTPETPTSERFVIKHGTGQGKGYISNISANNGGTDMYIFLSHIDYNGKSALDSGGLVKVIGKNGEEKKGVFETVSTGDTIRFYMYDETLQSLKELYSYKIIVDGVVLGEDGTWQYWENGVRQEYTGMAVDSETGKQYWFDSGIAACDKQVYDPDTDAWYWFDADGSMAVDKDVYVPESNENRDNGKWVRYDENGGMVKGEDYRYGGWYRFDEITGEMIKGWYTAADGAVYYYNVGTGQREYGIVEIDKVSYAFDDTTGKLVDRAWYKINGEEYWYEDGIRQGTQGRGKEIYDPVSDAWYWLDAVNSGKKAAGKDVYQESYAGDYADKEDGTGKWVRYNDDGHMVKGWNVKNGNTYYFDLLTGAMAKGSAEIDGILYYFDWNTGILQSES